jgi:hypothetical protein
MESTILKTFSNNSDRIQYLQQQANYKVVNKLPLPTYYPSYAFKLSLTNGYKKCKCPQLIRY